MGDERYLWDDANLEHIARHNVEDFEAEEALEDPERIVGSAYNRGRERRYSIVGATYSGRILRVVFTVRTGRTRVVTAHEADKSERRRYKR